MVLLRFHLDVSESSDAFWWIDSPQVPTRYASAPSLIDARRRALDKLDAAGVEDDDMHYEMADAV